MLKETLRLRLLNTLTPITQIVGSVHAPYSMKLIEEDDVYVAMMQMKPGMVFIVRTDGQLTNPFIPGFWSHVAMVVDDHHVVEAVGAGVKKTGIFDFLMRKDYAVLLRPTFATDQQMVKAAEFAFNQQGAKYDWLFRADSISKIEKLPVSQRAFFCARLPQVSYRESCGEWTKFTTRTTLGVETCTPQDYVNAIDKWARVWWSHDSIQHLEPLKA